MLTRIALLFSIVWLTRLVQPWLQVAGRSFSGRDVVLLLGGLFLLAKSVLEIHQTLEGPAPDAGRTQLRGQLVAVIAQIGLVDIVFSLDSVFTAGGVGGGAASMGGGIRGAVHGADCASGSV